MKNIVFIYIYESLGVKIVFFVGYNMFVFYEGVIIEYEIVRNGVGVFDVLYMGEFLVIGFNVLDLI